MWIFYAFASRLFWACGGVLDQLIARAHPRPEAVSALTLAFCAQAPFGLLALGLGGGWPPGKEFLGWVILGAAADIAGFLPYYQSMREEEARDVTPFLELTAVFLTALAFFLRGEALSHIQLGGAALVILCGFLFSWDFKKSRVKGRVLALMTTASFFFAVTQLAVRMVSEGVDPWSVAGAFMLGQSAAGLLVFALHRGARESVCEALKVSRGRTFLLALGEGGFSMLGLFCLTQAFMLAPSTGQVAGLSGTQPFLSFFVSGLLALIFPRHFRKVVFDRETRAKLCLLAGILAGVWMLAG
jgi:drug/metabolite transporter (DMT)-like permease